MKDKEKHQPVPEPITAGEPINSSTAVTLLQLNKEKEKIKEAEKKESAAEAAKVRCRVCFKEVAPKRLCSGHGAGGGGGDSASSGKTSEEKASPGEDKSLTKPSKVVETTDELIGEFGSEELASESKSFDPEIIAKLIADGSLLVDIDRKSMTLTIKLQCEPNKLNEEQREELKKFTEAIIKEFNEFKEKNHLPDNCIQITQDKEGNILSLHITIPKSLALDDALGLFDAFIQLLADNLVPTPSPKAQEKDEVTKDQSLAPNPFSMEPKPSRSTTGKEEEEEKQQQPIFNPSPFKMNP